MISHHNASLNTTTVIVIAITNLTKDRFAAVIYGLFFLYQNIILCRYDKIFCFSNKNERPQDTVRI